MLCLRAAGKKREKDRPIAAEATSRLSAREPRAPTGEHRRSRDAGPRHKATAALPRCLAGSCALAIARQPHSPHALPAFRLCLTVDIDLTVIGVMGLYDVLGVKRAAQVALPRGLL